MKIITLIFILGFSGLSFAQTVDSKKTFSPLSFKISLSKIDRTNRSLSVKLRIQNMSDRDVIIDKNAVRYKVIFKRKGRHFPDGGIGPGEARVITGDPSAEYRGDFVKLRPGGVHIDSETLYIDDAFFDKNRQFTLSLTYGFFRDDEVNGLVVWRGVVSSNEIRFKNK